MKNGAKRPKTKLSRGSLQCTMMKKGTLFCLFATSCFDRNRYPFSSFMKFCKKVAIFRVAAPNSVAQNWYPFSFFTKKSLFLKKDTLFRVSVQKLTCTKRVCLFVTSFFSHNFTRHKKLVKSKNRIYSEISKKSTLLRAKG